MCFFVGHQAVHNATGPSISVKHVQSSPAFAQQHVLNAITPALTTVCEQELWLYITDLHLLHWLYVQYVCPRYPSEISLLLLPHQ